LEDALEFCYSENVNKFDVIDCSNMADHVGLVNLILACIGKLWSSKSKKN
jgi:2-polyprenyl-3-methyl-5-hydroxy-6-metoxy-1,4-benzoquinol methylase